MKKNLIPIILGAFITILLLGGMWIYFRQSTRIIDLQENSAQEGYDRHYVLIADDIDTSLWQEVYESAQQAALNAGAYLEMLDSDILSEYTLEDYLRISIASKVDGIIMRPNGSESVRDLIREAADSGIPVVTALEDDSESARISFVGINSYQLGTAYGEEILKLLQEGQNDVLILENANNRSTGNSMILSQIANVVHDREKDGCTAELSTYDINITGNFDSEEAIRDLFVNQRNIPDILVCLDEVVTECAYQAIVDYNQVGNVNIIGYHTSDVILDAIRRGTIASTVSFSTAQIGQYSVDALEEYQSLGHVSNYFNVGLNIVNSENVQSFLPQEEAEEN